MCGCESTELAEHPANEIQFEFDRSKFVRTDVDLNRIFECYVSPTGGVILALKNDLTIMTGGNFNLMTSESVNIVSGAIMSQNKSGMINLNPNISPNSNL